jgi:hypothetical protein
MSANAGRLFAPAQRFTSSGSFPEFVGVAVGLKPQRADLI